MQRDCVRVPRNQFHHSQTARFNNPTFLSQLQTLSSVFGPAGGAALTRRLSPYVQMLLTHQGSWPFNLTTEHQHTN